MGSPLGARVSKEVATGERFENLPAEPPLWTNFIG